MALAVRLRSVVALLGGFPALAGADLEVAEGEVVLLQGPNGAGKTSLLRVCAGLLAVVEGEADVLGHDLTRDRRAVRRHVGLLGHAGSVYDDLTVEENVHFTVRAAGGPVAAVAPTLARLGLHGRLRRLPVSRLSAGQRRRVAIAGIAARRPALWLLDEPHAGLDAAGRELLDTLVREEAASGATVVLASHDSERSAALAHRLVAVSGGYVSEAGGREHGPAARPPARTGAAHVA